ncbi:uncharacterized protein LOC107873345 isoform X4 [Capsicum annuum]|uniref:uncharacterized protein LOC107873345 isoform X4 n=1 Tax=Capsicum annuum TaxID=4072 RepID=UPI001FB0EA10|nr:uncharacterized protein LOC107873345 isoform X4 [Capsicum annuum]
MFSWNLARSAETLFSRWAIKSFCNFLLKKKLGKFILGVIDPNQLVVQLSAGTIQLSNLALNVDYLNQKVVLFTNLRCDFMFIELDSEDMGCFVSMPQETGGNKRPGNIGKVSVFVLGLRIPKPVDFSLALGDHLSKTLVECLSVLRTRIVIMAGQEAPTITRSRRKVATQHGSRRLFACSFGTSYDGSILQHKVQFIWVNQEDDAEVKLEICFPFCFLFMLTVLFVFSTMRENYIICQKI